MRTDQHDVLQSLAGKLLDVAIEELNPDLWPGAGKQPRDLTKQERGDRVWAKRNADATLDLVIAIARLVYVRHDAPESGQALPPDEQAKVDEEIRSAEREAKVILGRFALGGRRRRKFKEGPAEGAGS